ncbi:hypothetical protein PPL_02958 [Heterostelium album PN500]|uniref:histone deacetylase n=1 Tax=Heterostelium pallidum (strain ATCC 26659 / Pp 5 / PN500) TaxID=670386 RepID=D3B3J0_HETP5|nr:hypothetical protein PPL_02958 [Heterostelium album PN500]EFA83888.1 hypothetical protein PPL_02958 [Heterostelium album PN500]|eukprot:XP_020436005.1 hypothetical protein PPL_02958 [Heterostelium album PN500]
MGDPQRGQMPEKPPCCASAARGHCTGHCPRIEDVLYSQRKGKTNKGAQRWRCKACGTKWTSKGIIIPPVVPDTIVNSIGYGSGPEEISLDLSARTTRPYKKSRMSEGGIISTSPSPFPSLFNSNSPNGSPISSPPSPTQMISTVPSNSRSLMPSNNSNISGSYVPILPTQASSNHPSQQQQQQQQMTGLRTSQSGTRGLLSNNNNSGNSNNMSGMLSNLKTNNNNNNGYPSYLPNINKSSNLANNQSINNSNHSNINSMGGPTKPVVVGPSQSGSSSGRQLSYSSSQIQQLSQSGNPQSSQRQTTSTITNNRLAVSKSSPTGTNSPNNPSKLFMQSTPYQPQSSSSLRMSPTNPIPKVPSIYQNSMREMSQSPTTFAGNLSNGSDSPTNNINNNNTPLLFQEPMNWNVTSQFGTINSSHKNNIQNASYVPAHNIIECLKRITHSVAIFSHEIAPDNRLKLNNYLLLLSVPSADAQFNIPASRKILASIDLPLFQIAKSYQALYQRISHHHAAMEDNLLSVGETYFDDNEIMNLISFSDTYQPIEELYESVVQDVQQHREVLLNKKESLESSLTDPNLIGGLNVLSTPENNAHLEQTRNDTAKILDSFAPLESALSNIESRLRAINKELSLVNKILTMLEVLYYVHIQSWKPIIEKHQRLVQNYLVDIIHQSLVNADKMAFSYSLLKSNGGKRSIGGGNPHENSENDQFIVEANANPFVNKLTEILDKYESSKQSISPSSSSIVPKDRKILAVYHSECMDHVVPEDHPESPKRLNAVIKAINEYAKQTDRLVIKDDPEEISDKWILTVHSPDYLRQLDEFTEKLEPNEIRPLNVNDGATQAGAGIQFTPASDGEDGDTFISKNSLKAAKRAAGATLAAVDQVLKGVVSSAFVAARPPGHHAGREGLTSGTTSQGFCLLNNVAIAAKYAQLRYGVEKIAIVDFDVHHGNGTEEILAGDPGFQFLSIHMFEEGFYPGSGGGGSHGVILPNGETPEPLESEPNVGPPVNNIVNIPMDPKSSAGSFIKAFSIIIEKLNEYQPELLLISCGFDAHIDDHLASLCLHEENYIEITKKLRQVADQWCRGRLISVLEGGYNITALRQCTIAHLMALTED